MFRPWKDYPSMRVSWNLASRAHDVAKSGFEHCVLVNRDDVPCWHPDECVWCVFWSDHWAYPGEEQDSIALMNRSDRRKAERNASMAMGDPSTGNHEEWCWPVFDEEEEE
eukprot:3199284-Amphidinium_carterae.1